MVKVVVVVMGVAVLFGYTAAVGTEQEDKNNIKTSAEVIKIYTEYIA